jgi:hypothetical protein
MLNLHIEEMEEGNTERSLEPEMSRTGGGAVLDHG